MTVLVINSVWFALSAIPSWSGLDEKNPQETNDIDILVMQINGVDPHMLINERSSDPTNYYSYFKGIVCLFSYWNDLGKLIKTIENPHNWIWIVGIFSTGKVLIHKWIDSEIIKQLWLYTRTIPFFNDKWKSELKCKPYNSWYVSLRFLTMTVVNCL